MKKKMNKLLIRHLPDWFTTENTKNFLKDYGAIDVTTFDKKGKMKCCAFARFIDESSTLLALRNLHQLELFGNRLVVEFAKDKQKNLNIQKDNLNLDNKTNQLDELNINYFDLPSIDFKYPPASELIVNNISKSLFNYPQFYNQVLYLMSKMNLPPPFLNTGHNLNKQFSLNSKEIIKLNDNNINQLNDRNINQLNDKNIKQFNDNNIDKLNNDQFKEKNDNSNDKNKLDNNEDDEDINKLICKLIKQKKRKLEQKCLNDKKFKLINQSNDNQSNIIEYFDNYKIDLKDKNRIQIDKELKLNFNNLDNEIKDGFGKFNCKDKLNSKLNDDQLNSKLNKNQLDNKPNNDQLNQNDLSIIELNNNSINKLIEYKQLNKDELKNYTVFNEYSIGEPSCRLYIKNVDKKVTENQLKLIYLNKLNLNSDDQLNSFNINLFKKGKMNGQAFISLLDENLAKEAIDKTNGLIINNKPIVVCFARSKIKNNSD